MEAEEIHELQLLRNGRAETLISDPNQNSASKGRILTPKFCMGLLVLSTLLVLFLLHGVAIHFRLRGTKFESDKICQTSNCLNAALSIISSMDTSVDPCQDFYQFACGGWSVANPLPPNVLYWDKPHRTAFEIIFRLKNLLEGDTDQEAEDGEAMTKAKIFYRSCLDEDQNIEKLGVDPLQNILREIGGWSISPSNFSLENFDFMKKLQTLHHTYFAGVFFHTLVYTDTREPSNGNVVHIYEHDTSAPVSSSSLSKMRFLDDQFEQENKSTGLNYMMQVAMALGADDSNETREKLSKILGFEKELQILTKEVKQNEANSVNTRQFDSETFNLTQLDLFCPIISWKKYFEAALLQSNLSLTTEIPIILVHSPTHIKKVCQILTEKLATPQGTVQLNDYMVWQGIEKVAPFLSKKFSPPGGQDLRWPTCVAATEQSMPLELAAGYIKKFPFDPKTKQALKTMFENIRTVFQTDLQNLDWITDNETVWKINEKADKMELEVGHPNFYTDDVLDHLNKKFGDPVILENDYLGNQLRSLRQKLRDMWHRLGQPVNKGEWLMYPWTVNGYYNPIFNKIFVPAAYLSVSNFDPELPNSVNYGFMGTMLAHEFTHGFDDSGRKYDPTGSLTPSWWSNSTIHNFNEKAQCLVDQYSGFVMSEKKFDGLKSLGENIADNGAAKTAFNAFRSRSGTEKKDFRLIGVKLSNDQLFFVAFAQSWCMAATDKGLEENMDSDNHAPPPLRVRASLQNFPQFSTAFHCPLGSPMNPQKKCAVW